MRRAEEKFHVDETNKASTLYIYIKIKVHLLTPKQYRHRHQHARNAHIRRLALTNSRQFPENAEHAKK